MRRLLASRKLWTVAIALATTLGAAAQDAKKRNARPLRNQGGAPLKKVEPRGGDPLARAADPKAAGALGTYHYTFKLRSFDNTPLASSYYPSKLGANAPVVILVHEKNRSRKDFEDPVLELKGRGLAGHLQSEGYAVLTMDLRGQGQNPRRQVGADEHEAMADDLQAAYQFILDRHNRGELNVGKLGAVGLGEGANLAVAWAYQPGAAVSTEGRAGDLAALALVSPQADGSGYVLSRVAPPVALRVPMLLMAGAKDTPSKDAVEAVRKDLERGRANKVETFPSSLHGYKLLRLEPKAADALVKYLDANLKNRPNEWEPRYNQVPVAFSDVQVVHPQAAKAAEPKKAAVEKAEPKKDAEPKKKGADEGEPAPKSEKSE
ncbi:MAG: hypothetical protein BGO49_10435 [Planctomycetales bacterium 71-10]|nr:MAG: hypothetical protein BGO49_10435 [Planctomycetales bacterium 71-10]